MNIGILKTSKEQPFSIDYNVSEYAMFAGDIIANEVSHHQQIWV
jgi:hypothetical protein